MPTLRNQNTAEYNWTCMEETEADSNPANIPVDLNIWEVTDLDYLDVETSVPGTLEHRLAHLRTTISKVAWMGKTAAVQQVPLQDRQQSVKTMRSRILNNSILWRGH
jgi:hypothetical protein